MIIFMEFEQNLSHGKSWTHHKVTNTFKFMDRNGGATCILGRALAPPNFFIFFIYKLSIFYKYLKVICKKNRSCLPNESIDKII